MLTGDLCAVVKLKKKRKPNSAQGNNADRILEVVHKMLKIINGTVPSLGQQSGWSVLCETL